MDCFGVQSVERVVRCTYNILCIGRVLCVSVMPFVIVDCRFVNHESSLHRVLFLPDFD
jgi:hypothetical protein